MSDLSVLLWLTALGHTLRHLRHHRGCLYLRRICHIHDLDIEDEVLIRLMAGSGLLIISQVSGDVQSTFASFLKLPQAIVPTLDDLSLSYYKFKRLFGLIRCIGFKYFSGGEQFAGITYRYLFAGVYLGAFAGGLYHHVNTFGCFFCIDLIVCQVAFYAFDFPVFFFSDLLAPVSCQQVLGREDIQYFESDNDLIFLFDKRSQLTAAFFHKVIGQYPTHTAIPLLMKAEYFSS